MPDDLRGHNEGPALLDTTSMLAELQGAINQVTLTSSNNAPIWISTIAQLRDVASQLTAGPPLTELNGAINHLVRLAAHNASVPFNTLNSLNDVYSQLSLGPLTTNPPDLQAIQQLEQAIVAQEPDWAPLLWINWTSGSTTLTVQVRGIATITMVISASPWWTNWPTMYEAANQIIATVYLMQMATTSS